MKVSKSRHNLFSKIDHDKVFIEKNYKNHFEDGNNHEELPPLRLDVRKRIANEQLKLKLQQKTSVITHATSLIKDLCKEEEYEEEDNISVKSNYSDELEKLKTSNEMYNITDNLLDELGYIGQIKEEEASNDDSDNQSEYTFTTYNEAKRKNFTSTLDVHQQFMSNASAKGTLREIKSVGSIKKIITKEQSMKAQQLDLLSNPVKDKQEYETNNSFLFLSKLTSSSSKPSTKQSESSPLSSSSKRQNNSVSIRNGGTLLKEYVASPVGYAYSNKATMSFSSEKLPLFGKPINQDQLVTSSLSIKTQLSVNKSFDTKGSILNTNKVSNNAIIRMSPMEPHIDENIDSSTGLQQSPSKFHVPLLHAIHAENKPILQTVDKFFHRITVLPADPKPQLKVHTKEPLNRESLFGEQLIMKADIVQDQKLPSDIALKNLLRASATSSSAQHTYTNNDTSNQTALILEKLDGVLERQQGQEQDNQSIRSSNTLETPAIAIMKQPIETNHQHQHHSPINSLSKYQLTVNTDGFTPNQSMYEIDVHSLHLPSIKSSSGKQQGQHQMICLYNPNPNNTILSSKTKTTVAEANHNLSSKDLVASKKGHNESSSSLLHSKHSSSFTIPGTMYIPLVGEQNHHHSPSTSPVLYKQALTNETQQYISELQHTSSDPDAHASFQENIVSDIFKEEDNDSASQRYIARSVANATNDRGMYSIDPYQQRSLLPHNIPDLLDEGYIYQHATNTYVHRDDINHSKYGQYQRSAYISPWSKYQQSQWTEISEDAKNQQDAEEDFDPFSERQFDEFERNSAGVGSPVIYIPSNKEHPPVVEPPVSALDNQKSIHSPYTSNTGLGITELEAGDVLNNTNYKSARSEMLYPYSYQGSPMQAIHHQPRNMNNSYDDNHMTAVVAGGLGVNFTAGDDMHTGRSSSIDTFENDNSVGKVIISQKAIPSSPSVHRIKNQINDYIDKLDSMKSPQQQQLHKNQSMYSMHSIATTDTESDIARAKLWSKLNNRYTGDKEGTYNTKMKIKKYVFDGIKETTQIENKYMSDMDDWF